MSLPPLPLFARPLTPNPTIQRTSATGRVPYLNTRLNTSSYSVTSPSATTTTPTSPGSSSTKPRQKSKVQTRPKTHHTTTSDSRSKSKAKADSRPKGSKLRMRVKRDTLREAPNVAISDPALQSERKDHATVEEYPDPSTEDDETEGEAEAETDRDTAAEADTSVEADASRTLTVDLFSAEEERIITVLSRKLEQLRESETTNSSPLCPVEAPSPPVPLPSTTAVSLADVDPLSPSPAPSSPSSVYAAPVASPINHRNGPTNANPSAGPNGEAKSNGHAVPIAVNRPVTSNGHTNGKDTHHEDGIPIEFSSTFNRTYGAHISTLSSPEMSLSASPCDTYDTRWMGPKMNGIGFATVYGKKPLPPSNGKGRARFEDLQTTQGHSYEQDSEHQTQTQLMLHALMQENDQLKSRLAETEGNYLRLASLNEAYRVELIDYRSRLGLPVDNLIGLASDPLPEPPTRTQNPQTYHHHHHPSSALGSAFNSNHDFNTYNNNTNTNVNGNQYHHSYAPSATFSPSNSTNVSNPPSPATTHDNHHRTGGSYMPSRIANGFGYENGHNNIDEGFGTASANHVSRNTTAVSSTTLTNGVPIPRPLSQVHMNRLKQSTKTMPMSVPNTDNSLLYKHGSTSRGVTEPRTLSTSTSYSSPPYSNNSPALLSPSYSSSYSAASSSAASSSAASSVSASTNVTSPPSSLSFTMMMMLPPTFGVPSRGLSYPLVPPPSLSSSLGSGSGGWEGAGGASGNLSPVDPSGPSRRGSNAGMSVGRRGSFSSGAAAGSTGGRVIETGSLRRSRGGSLNHGSGHISRPETVDETEGDHEDSSTLQGLAGIREP